MKTATCSSSRCRQAVYKRGLCVEHFLQSLGHMNSPQVEGEKECCRCHVVKALVDFSPNGRRPDGRQPTCRDCTRASRRRSCGVLPELSHLKPGPEATCAICETKSELRLDHDHATGKMRGWLCNRCNSGIGFLQDDAALCLAAYEYLVSNAETISP